MSTGPEALRHIPTTEQARARFAYDPTAANNMNPEWAAEFDRMLANVRADVLERAAAEARGGDIHFGFTFAEGSKADFAYQWLRARASEERSRRPRPPLEASPDGW